jgi:hypothetical protein
MRRGDLLCVLRIEENVGVTEVVRDDHDDVGFGFGCRERCAEDEKREDNFHFFGFFFFLAFLLSLRFSSPFQR